MKLKLAFAMVAALIVVGILTGCSAEKTYGSMDTSIRAKAGSTFSIKLDENPTTGYRWAYTVSDETVVKLIKDDYVPDNKSGNLLGSGGKRVLTFEAKSKGDAVIDMVYERSFEKHLDDTKITYKIEVK